MKTRLCLIIVMVILLAGGYSLFLFTDAMGRNLASHVAPVCVVAGLGVAVGAAWRKGMNRDRDGRESGKSKT